MATRRCAVCGRRLRPALTAVRDQKVCCRKCRLERRRLQAKQRRESDLQRHRADDKERQQRHRAAVKKAAAASAQAVAAAAASTQAAPHAAQHQYLKPPNCGQGVPEATAEGGCHGPGSSAKSAELQDRIDQIVADAVRRSRTGFEQELRRMTRKIRPLVQSELARGGP